MNTTTTVKFAPNAMGIVKNVRINILYMNPALNAMVHVKPVKTNTSMTLKARPNDIHYALNAKRVITVETK